MFLLIVLSNLIIWLYVNEGDFIKRLSRKGIVLYGYAMGWGLSLILFYIWLCAWLNGDQVVVTINDHGEALVELFLLPVVLIWVTVGLILYMWELKKK